MEKIFESTFNLNRFELEAFEKQRVQTTLIFQNSMMLMLDFFVFMGVLRMPNIDEVNKSGSILLFQTYDPI